MSFLMNAYFPPNFITKTRFWIIMRKSIPILFVLVTGLLLFIAEPSLCTTQPSTPSFTIQITNHSLDIPATYSIDPFTNEKITKPENHLEWRTIDFMIKNQPFTYLNINGSSTELYYNIRYKGHFGTDWIPIFGTQSYPIQNASSQNTLISLVLDGQNASQSGLHLLQLPLNAQVDFQVQAMIGVINRVIKGPMSAPWVFTGESSDWSSTQTIAIGEVTQTATLNPSQSSTSPSANPTASQVFGLDCVGIVAVVLLVVIAVLLVFVVFYLRRRSVNGSFKKPPV
jgi:hypothetical protein